VRSIQRRSSDYWTFQKSSRCVPDWLAEIGQHPIQEKSKILAKLAEDTVPSWENRLIACSRLFADRYFPHVPDALADAQNVAGDDHAQHQPHFGGIG
jgi:hypothetical protein